MEMHTLIKLVPLIGRIREASATCLRRLRSTPIGDDTSTTKESLEGAVAFDCVDRIALNAYFRMGHGGGGFWVWWGR
jgi:hypothetical protein